MEKVRDRLVPRIPEPSVEKVNPEKLPTKKTLMLSPKVPREPIQVGDTLEVSVPVMKLPDPLPVQVGVCIAPAYLDFKDAEKHPFDQVYNGNGSLNIAVQAKRPSTKAFLFVDLFDKQGNKLDTAVSIDFTIR